jgi:DNA (cytosine-5)-methyltransferase 1
LYGFVQAMNPTGPTLVDLFAGCGGMTRGFVDAGYRPVQAVEWDVAAAATYEQNFGRGHVIAGDIAAVGDDDLPTADLVIGGPPCQGFSGLGTRDPDDPRNTLWREYMRAVLAVDPQVFVLENVDRFSRSTEFELLMTELATGRLRRWGHVEWRVVNAADYGVAQQRRRTVLVASRVGPVPLPAPTHARGGGNGLSPWVTLRDVFKGVPRRPREVDLPDSRDEWFGQVMPGPYKSPQLHVTRRPTVLSLTRYAHIPPGGGRFNLPTELLPPCWANKSTGTTDVMGRLRWDEPSVTIRTEFFKPEKGRYLHPQWDRLDPDKMVNRPITHYEAALIQSFPKNTEWVGTKTQIARQIGNAVPPLLAGAVARQLLPHLG